MIYLVKNLKLCFSILILVFHNFVFGQTPSELDLEDFTMKARQKAFELGENLSKISNKDTPRETKRMLINSTMDMFKDGNCKVEVTSIKDTTRKRQEPIRHYLNRISDFAIYDKVELQWNQVHVITKIHKDEKGDYWGVIRVIQKFKGLGPDDKEIYKDVTEKEIEVKLENFKVENGSKIEDFYVLKFGDVKVIETKKEEHYIKP